LRTRSGRCAGAELILSTMMADPPKLVVCLHIDCPP
jgi:hypothetical protein